MPTQGCSRATARHLLLAFVATAIVLGTNASRGQPGWNSICFSETGSMGGFGTGSGMFQYPQGIAIGINNEVHVVDDSNQRIQVFDKFTLSYQRQYGHGIFYPNDVAVTPYGTAFTCEYGTDVFAHSLYGAYLFAFSTESTGARPWPGGIYFHPPTDRLVVAGASTENSRLSTWSSSGRLLHTWYTPRNGTHDVWVSQAGEIFTAGWTSVLRYSMEGVLLGSFPVKYGAVAISGDDQGVIYVMYYYLNQIDAYSTAGSWLGSYTMPNGNTPPQPYSGHTYGLAYAGPDYLFATDRVNHRVIRLGITRTLSPTVLTAPQPLSVPTNTQATFEVTASGSEPLSYQWWWNANPIPGATNSSLTLSNVTTSQSGQYYVEVSNCGGRATSSGAQLQVVLPPRITAQPQNIAVSRGAAAAFRVVVEGLGPFQYQWQCNGTNLVGATNAALILNNVTRELVGTYQVVVSNLGGTTVSQPAALQIQPVVILANGVPLTEPKSTFYGSVAVEIRSSFSGGTVFFSLDMTPPNFLSTPYRQGFNLRRTATLWVKAYNVDFSESEESAPMLIEVIPLYPLHSSSAGGGYVMGANTFNLFPSNSIAHLQAAAFTGWSFMGWQGDADGESPSISVLMNRPKCVTAIFGTPVGFTVAGDGGILAEPKASLYPEGGKIQLTALPASGSYFVGWVNAGNGTNNPYEFSVNSPQPTVSALFAPLPENQFTLIAAPQGMGSVRTQPYANRYHRGQAVILTAIPQEGQEFLGWTGSFTATNNPITVSMDASRTVTAHFTRRPKLDVLSCGRSAPDNIRMRVHGRLGDRYRILASHSDANHEEWTALMTLTNVLGSAQFTDSTTNRPARLYRVEALD